MILDFVVGGLISLVVSVLTAVLPTTAVPVDAIGTLVHGYAWFNTFLPLSEALDLAVLTVQVAGVLLGVYAVFWFLQQVPLLHLGGR